MQPSYEGDDNTAKPTEPSPAQDDVQGTPAVPPSETPAQSIEFAAPNGADKPDVKDEPDLDSEANVYGQNIYGDDNAANGMNGNNGMNNMFHMNGMNGMNGARFDGEQSRAPQHMTNEHGFSGTVGIKEDG